jgi:hypothetical protein
MKVTLADQVQCARREIQMRRRVYPKRIAAGKMQVFVADRETAGMQAIAKTLQWLLDGGLLTATPEQRFAYDVLRDGLEDEAAGKD